MRFRRLALLASSVVLFSTSYAMDKVELNNYQKAESLLVKKDYPAYYQVKAKLAKAPLYPFLQYQEISLDPDYFKQETI